MGIYWMNQWSLAQQAIDDEEKSAPRALLNLFAQWITTSYI